MEYIIIIRTKFIFVLIKKKKITSNYIILNLSFHLREHLNNNLLIIILYFLIHIKIYKKNIV